MRKKHRMASLSVIRPATLGKILQVPQSPNLRLGCPIPRLRVHTSTPAKGLFECVWCREVLRSQMTDIDLSLFHFYLFNLSITIDKINTNYDNSKIYFAFSSLFD